MNTKKCVAVLVSAMALGGCAMTPEQRQAVARSMSNYHPYILPPVQQQQAPQVTTTNCWTPAQGQVSCTSRTQ